MFDAEQEDAYKASLARFYRQGKHKGAGILVAEGYVLTCAHVLSRKNEQPEIVHLDFPFHPTSEPIVGAVVYWDWERDIAGVQLSEPAPTTTRPLPLTASSHYTDHRFRAYGFPEKHATGGWALGAIVGSATGDLVQIQGDSNQGYGIEPGFSGAPVWDENLGCVIGLARLRDQDRPEAKVAYLIPYRQLITALKMGEAVSLLTVLDPYLPDIQPSLEGAYQVCRPEGSLELIPKGLLEQLDALSKMHDGPTGHPALVRFATCLTLAEFPVATEARAALQQWLQNRAEDVAAVVEAITPAVNAHCARTAPEASPHLLIWLSANHSQGTFPVEALFIPDANQYDPEISQGFEPLPVMAQYGEPITPEQLPNVLRDCIKACKSLGSDINLLTIDLLLPLSLLQQALEWEPAYEADLLDFLEPEPIATLYRFTVRSSERLINEYTRNYGSLWETKWNHLQDHLSTIASIVLHPVDETVAVRQLLIDLKNPQMVGLKMATPPAQSDIPASLKGLLGSGAPVAIWLREAPSRVACCSSALETLLSCYLQTLKQSVQTARQNAFPLEKDAHIGHHLSLVWEDPKLVPPATKELAS
ncbi:MAG: trypsin-like peptidase domain-containing protein [Leptolyngbyaceae cyanobacterium]